MIGKTISQYRIVERLGEGGMGVVYKAEDATLGRSVALKFLSPHTVANDEERARLMREARAAAALLHPGICPVYEIGNLDGQSFIVMAHLEGQSLEKRIAAGPLAPAEAIGIAVQVGEALAAAHAKGIVHRDIKPANVMLTTDDRAVLMDFGLAMISGSTRLTRDGTTMGTMAYMSPEQCRAEPVDERCDVWALGVMLYEMVAGRVPFKGDFPAAMIFSIMNHQPEPLDEDREDIPAGLAGILDRALTKEPALRYQKVAEFVADLKELMTDSAATPQGRAKQVPAVRRTWGPWGTARKSGFAAGTVVVLVVVVLGLSRVLMNGGSAAIDSLGILPLQNLSGDASQDIWAQGVTEQLSASIGTIASLKVVSDQSMKQFKDSSEPLPVIGEKIGAKGLVEGSIQVVGEEIQITVKLYDAGEDRMLWSETYRRPVRDILNVQGEIAAAIAEQVEAVITPDENERLVSSAEVDPAAYKAYLIGMNQTHQLSVESIRDAIASFRRAITIDPTYAQPYAGLSRAHYFNALLSSGPPIEEFGFARAAAAKALELDPNSAEGHAAMADIMTSFDWDWAGAEREYRRAIALNPNLGSAHAGLASFLTAIGRGEEGVPEARISVELDPLNGFFYINLAWNLLYSNREPEALDVLKTTLRLHPEAAAWAYNHMAWSYMGLGQAEAACAAYDSALTLAGDEFVILTGAAKVFGTFGRTDDARALMARVTTETEKGYIDPYMLSFGWDGLGKIDRALDLLEQAYAEKSPSIWGLRIELFSDEMRAHPRFQAVLRKMDFP